MKSIMLTLVLAVFFGMPSDARAECSPTVYQIVRGDTLSEISERMLGGASLYPAIAEMNAIADPNRIYAGETLMLPCEIVEKKQTSFTATNVAKTEVKNIEAEIIEASEFVFTPYFAPELEIATVEPIAYEEYADGSTELVEVEAAVAVETMPTSGILEEGIYQIVLGPSKIQSGYYPATVNIELTEQGWQQMRTSVSVEARSDRTKISVYIERDVEFNENSTVAFDYGDGVLWLGYKDLAGQRVITLSSVSVKKPERAAYATLLGFFPAKPSRGSVITRNLIRYGAGPTLAVVSGGVSWALVPPVVDSTGALFRAKAQEKYNQAATLLRQIK